MAGDPSITFRFIASIGEAAGHIPVLGDVRAIFGKARPALVVAVNDHTYRSTVSIMAGKVFVPFRASHREAAEVAPGDEVEVTLTLDTAPRTVEAPADLLAALAAAGLGWAWAGLSFSHQREWVEAVEGAKRPDTRAKRIAACVAKLTG